jgi:photosystem II stability/assembly factor-like uncharacterized protein
LSSHKVSFQSLLTGFIVLGIIILPVLASTQLVSGMKSQPVAELLPRLAQQTPGAPTFTTSATYLPLVVSTHLAQIVLSSAVTSDETSTKTSFLPGSTIRFIASGTNQSTFPGTVNLRWTLSGPCDTTEIFSDKLTLQPGPWQHMYATTVPGCQGFYLSSVEMINGDQTSTLSTLFVVFPPSTVVVSSRQGFDRCLLPTIEQMQTWRDKSPYRVFNIYLGGISFACSSNPLNEFWLYSVAQQGWSFILTWVGPQAPCKNYTHPMSSNANTAYQQGRTEAASAAAAAGRLGFLVNKIIYYDVESYSGASASCRATVAAFLRGWAERLHELGFKAGAYGAPCTSYISDWAANHPPPDDVWIAHWYKTDYDASASVWGAPCLSDSLWTTHQRLKQYVGGHSETWGGETLIVDSSKLDGQITAFQASLAGDTDSSSAAAQSIQPPQVRTMDLLEPDTGWVLVGDRLLWTRESGTHWTEISPPAEASGSILAVNFLDLQKGWLVRRTDQTDGWGQLSILFTDSGGLDWRESLLEIDTGFDALPVAAAFLDFVDAQTGWLALQLQTGSSFSLGRLFFTRDGGLTWQERSLPLGEPVEFIDAERGWVTGGPSGEFIYRTLDGGRTWQEQTLPLPDDARSGRILVGRPVFINPNEGYLPVTLSAPSPSGFLVYSTQDSGESWSLASRLDFQPGFVPGSPLPFSLAPGGGWRVGSLGTAQSPYASSLLPVSPQGMLDLDFASDQTGWATIQDGSCLGDKLLPGAPPFQCVSSSHLLATSDGGRTWMDITPP